MLGHVLLATGWQSSNGRSVPHTPGRGHSGGPRGVPILTLVVGVARVGLRIQFIARLLRNNVYLITDRTTGRRAILTLFLALARHCLDLKKSC